MIRLHALVEGQTEETFVNEVLSPELGTKGVFCDARRITTGRKHGRVFRGGLVSYEHLARDLSLWMKEDQNSESWFTTMIDFYRLPQDFPGQSTDAPNLPKLARVSQLEAALQNDMIQRLKALPVSRRFVPYIQVHEFEAILFSDPTAFLQAFPGNEILVNRLASIRSQFGTPEDINDGAETSPSRRIMSMAPDYQKPVAGVRIAQRIGLVAIRRECRHFDDWLTRLIALGETE